MSSSRMWNATYQHDRRKHRHRCRACWQIVNEGEPVVFARIGNKRTWIIHEACADKRHSEEYSWLEVFKSWVAPPAETHMAL